MRSLLITDSKKNSFSIFFIGLGLALNYIQEKIKYKKMLRNHLIP